MKAWGIEKFGDNAQVKRIDVPIPKLGDHDVLIKIKAASINPVDLKIRSGQR